MKKNLPEDNTPYKNQLELSLLDIKKAKGIPNEYYTEDASLPSWMSLLTYFMIGTLEKFFNINK